MWWRSRGVRLPVGMYYRSLAVQACNVVLCLVLVNVVAGIVVAITDEHDRRQLPPMLTAIGR